MTYGRPMEHLELSTTTRRVSPVLLAERFADRLFGIHAVSPGHHLLLPCSSVHGFGLHEELVVVGLDQHLRVLDRGALRRRSRWRIAGAVWILELVDSVAAPEVGEQLAARPIVGPCPASSTCVLPRSATSAT